MEYIIIQKDELNELSIAVCEKIKEGYIPVGGISVVGRTVSQAIYHANPPKEIGVLNAFKRAVGI